VVRPQSKDAIRAFQARQSVPVRTGEIPHRQALSLDNDLETIAQQPSFGYQRVQGKL
jgi:hypothetical protein